MTVGRFWSFLFLLVPILGVWCFVSAATDTWPFDGSLFAKGHWLPENVNAHGEVIDDLFYFILWLTGIIFVGCGIALFVFLWKYDAEKNKEAVKYVHGNHSLEIVWSILPAAILLFIAVYQMNAWADHKMRRPTEIVSVEGDDGHVNEKEEMLRPMARITARQFEWRIRYAHPNMRVRVGQEWIELNGDEEIGATAGEDGRLGTFDDVRDDLFTVNELVVPVNKEIVLQIESQDVLHSFFLPHMRVKQDVVPGMTQYVWFKPTKTGTYDIVCAELCGWGHYKMRGQLTVKTLEGYAKWFKEQYEKQEQTQFQPPKDEE